MEIQNTMIYQIHHQPKKYSDSRQTEMRLQFEASSYKDIESAVREAIREFPPPDGYQLMICDENSEFFWKTSG